MIDTKVSVVMFPVGIGNGVVVVLSNGRVVGGIRVTLPLGSESVKFVVAVTTKVPGVDSGSGVVGGFTMKLDLGLENEPVRSSLLVEPLKIDEDSLNEAVEVTLGADVTGALELT